MTEPTQVTAGHENSTFDTLSASLGFRYAAGLLMTWMTGTLLMSGWHFALIGSPSWGRSAGEGVIFLIIVAVLKFAFSALRGGRPLMPFAVALGLGLVCIGGGFPVGALTGGMWAGYGCAYPNMSGLPRQVVKSY